MAAIQFSYSCFHAPSSGSIHAVSHFGIFEIRGKIGTDITRVLYFFYYGKRIILTNDFIKKTQQTPKNEIKLAKTYRKDFLERVGKDNE